MNNKKKKEVKNPFPEPTSHSLLSLRGLAQCLACSKYENIHENNEYLNTQSLKCV
jgi:hypothetical protein